MMPTTEYGRRWEDVRTEIRAAVADGLLAFRLTLDRLDQEVQKLKTTVYGDPSIRHPGIVDRLDKIESRIGAMDEKIDTLIDESRARTNQIVGARKAFFVLAAVIAFVGGPPTIIAFLRTVGLTP